ncbi:Glycine receptor subunit beta-type 4 [Aphelenchoides fujianensis]|nr:Glycine receptor subunit beta-type 4 [Aphelenchoides fujianensis]
MIRAAASHFTHSAAPKHRKEFERENSELNARLREATRHFAHSPFEHAHPNEKARRHTNPFYETSFSSAYVPHDLCGPERSGGQTADLNWAEPADKLFRLLDHNGDPNGYNMFLPPGAERGQTTNVSVAIYIESMSSVKAQTMDYEVDCYLAMGWFDRRLSHNCTHPILITHQFVERMMWNPDLYFVNAKYAYLQDVTTPNFMMIVYPDGLVFKSLRTVVTLSCMMDLQFYPADQQSCPLTIQSYAYIENLMNLSWHGKWRVKGGHQVFPLTVDPPFYPIASNEALKLNDMEIKEIKYERCSGPYTMLRGVGNWSCIRAFIVMKRLMLYHIVQTFIPSAMLVFISWISFWLPPRASPARISLVVTSLLTLTTQSNGARQDLPQVSYLSALDIWQFVCQALIFAVLLEYSVVSYFVTRSTADCKHRHSTSKTLNVDSNGRNKEQSILQGGMPTDDLRIRLLDHNDHHHNNNNELIGRKVRADSAASLSPRPPKHAAVERAMSSGASLRTTYSVNAGIGQTINNAAELFATQCNVSTDDLYELSRSCSICKWENEQKARSIDYWSRRVFPTAYLLTVVVYATYYRYSIGTF